MNLRVLAKNSIFIYPSFILFIGLAVYTFFYYKEIDQINIFVFIVIFFIIFFDLFRHLLRPYHCIKTDEKNIYLYPFLKKEIIISVKDIKEVTYRFSRRYGGLNITTTDQKKYVFRNLYAGREVAVSIRNLMPKRNMKNE